MSRRSQVGKVLRQVGLYKFVVKSLRLYWRVYGMLTNRDARITAAYMAHNTSRKLHLGSGGNDLKGWLNTDLMPDSRLIRLDATKRFPFPDDTFDFVFSEHMIEHIPYRGGRTMIAESFRVLMPGGTIRIVTPNLAFLIKLYQDSQNPLHAHYIKWNSESFIGDKAPHHSVTVVNNFFKDWGHQYIYDLDTLKAMFAEIGFVDITECEIGKSQHPELSALEHDVRMPPGFLSLESMILEARKPG